MEAWGAFHLDKIFGLKFRKFSVSNGKAMDMSHAATCLAALRKVRG